MKYPAAVLVRAFSTSLLLAACVSCDRSSAITVEFYIEDGYRFSQPERDTIETIAGAAIPEVRRFLPTLPNDLILKVWLRLARFSLSLTAVRLSKE